MRHFFSVFQLAVSAQCTGLALAHQPKELFLGTSIYKLHNHPAAMRRTLRTLSSIVFTVSASTLRNSFTLAHPDTPP